MSLFPPIQQSILDVLADGLPHSREELLECFGDPVCLEDMEVGRLRLNSTLTSMRRVLRPMGHDVICEYRKRKICYRHVVLLVRTALLE